MKWNCNGENIKEAALNFEHGIRPLLRNMARLTPPTRKFGKRPHIGNMQHFRNRTSGRFFVNMWLNNYERKLPFAAVS